MASLPPIVLTFSATDPTGGAGMQADLLTLASLGCHPLSVCTALTVQDLHGVREVRALGADWVAAQARALIEALPVHAFKIGVLGSAENVAAVARILASRPQAAVVLDPVLASGRGDELADARTVAALRELLLPRTTVLTPNSSEARRLAQADELAQCAQRLIAMGCAHVLITGTHEPGTEVVNTLYGAHGVLREDRWPRLAGSYHGSGCTLASALAAQLARGVALPEAARAAQEYTWQALAAGFDAGAGQRLPDRFFALRRSEP